MTERQIYMQAWVCIYALLDLKQDQSLGDVNRTLQSPQTSVIAVKAVQFILRVVGCGVSDQVPNGFWDEEGFESLKVLYSRSR